MLLEIRMQGLLRWATLLAVLALISACASARPNRSAYSRQHPTAQRLANYHVPGPSSDPWGPFIQEAAARFRLPERWIREVMRRESQGELYQGGSLTTSSVGAMGLMQVMPGTYLMLQQRYSLGIDPYDPHDNVMAGTAYLREMYDRYGSPGFLAAYNAGPERLEEFLYGGTPLPAETVAYLAAIAPRLGNSIAPTGPLATYAMASNETDADELNKESANGSYQPKTYKPAPHPPTYQTIIAEAASASAETSDDAIARTLTETGNAETSNMPDSRPGTEQSADDLNRASLPNPSTTGADTASVVSSTAELPPPPRNWAIQVGAFSTVMNAQAAIQQAKSVAGDALDNAITALGQTTRGDGVVLYRAKLAGLSADAASTACQRLIEAQRACIVVPTSAEG